MSAWRNSTPSTFDAAAASDSADTSIDVKWGSGLLATSVTVCAPTPHPASSTGSRRIAGVVVEQLDERARLIVQPLAFALVVAVDVPSSCLPRQQVRPVPSATCCS